MGGARGGEYFISKPRWSSGKIAPGGPSSGLKGSILYLEIVDFFIFVEQRSCDGRGGAQRPVGRGNEQKRRVRAAHGRARAAKIHYIIYLSRVLCLSVCDCVCVSQFVSERSAILLVLGRDRDGEIGKRQIVEGGCEETFHC